MLSPRLNDCPECADIPSLLKKIDCKLAELGNNLYNNISYMLNKPVPAVEILQLIGYRRILTYKYCNPNYVHKYSVKMIASRVIRLTLGCVSRCNEPERCLEEPCNIVIVPNPPTTTTTSSSSTSTTTSTSTSTSSTSTTSTSSTTTSSTSSTTTTSTTLCPGCTTTTTSSTSTTTTTTTLPPVCVTACLPYFSYDNGVFINKNNTVINLTPYITGPIPTTTDIANTGDKLWLSTQQEIYEYYRLSNCPFQSSFTRIIALPSVNNLGKGLTAVDNDLLISSMGDYIVNINISILPAVVTQRYLIPTNREISGDMIFAGSNQNPYPWLICSFVDVITGDTYITIYNHNSGAIFYDINISSITNPWGLYLNNGVLQICDNDGQIYSLNLVTEALTLVGSAGRSLTGASQAPECNVINFPLPPTNPTEFIISKLEGLKIETLYIQKESDLALLPNTYRHPCPGQINMHECNRAFFEVEGNNVYIGDSLMNNNTNILNTPGIITQSGKYTCKDEFNVPDVFTGGPGTWINANGGPLSRYSKMNITRQQATAIANVNPTSCFVEFELVSVNTTYGSGCEANAFPHENVTWVRISKPDGTVIYNGCPVGNIVVLNICR